ncbi:F-box/LRR-repeat protein At5g63520 isoform X2 [Salvia miltiorrhiza]|uniref:F-box/LRR-repeat protein At5g63520 isoform X2 n=1 Tax=Salvia miltiorrhiza TaxID=226208 RepID=UPI0025ACE4EC|nr:F-box/LRR-repeat protein At5g63520 isoform X2 [Salvia miltiorrhiza]
MDELQSFPSLKKMSKAKEKTGSGSQNIVATIDDLGDDLMQNILTRLPALSFASAACVSRSWNSLCHRVLSVPKLCSAVSFNPTLENAVNEVMDKVLLEPIRPHFVMVSIGPYFCLQAAFQMIEGKFGTRIPVIVNVCEGVIGRNVLTDQFVEVQWEITEEEDHGAELLEEKGGISMTIGFLPGLKVHIVPLLFRNKGILIDDFVMDIKGATSTVSDPASPAGIILFSDRETDINPVLQTLEYALSEDTFIVGGGGCQFLYRSDNRNTITNSPNSGCAAVALVFARDANKPLDIGETKFHVMLSTGISPIGPTYKAASVKSRQNSTWLTASRETVRGHLDGQAILEEIYDELGDRIQYPAFYIGVTKRRKCSFGMERVRRMQFLEFHEVRGGDEEYLIVNSVGIKTGDPFRFYISDSGAALSSCTKLSNNLRHLKLGCDCGNNHVSDVDHFDKSNVFGGIIFTCCGRGDSFFGLAGIDSSPFLKNFPGVAFGGTYCAGEICRGNLNLYDQDNEEGDLVHCSQHVYSAVYLVMTYCPPLPQH